MNKENSLSSEKRTLKTEKKPVAGQILLHWKSPVRPFCKRSREYYTTMAALVFLLSVILFLIQNWLLILALWSVAFVAYVLSTVPPEKVEHSITTFGVETAGHLYPWWQLQEFWFEEKLGSQLLTIQTYLSFPGRLHIVIEEVDRHQIKDKLQQYLPYRKQATRNFIDKVANWISKKIPLEATAS